MVKYDELNKVFHFPKYRRNMCASDYKEFALSRDCLPTELSTFGNTDQRTPSFHAVYKNGSCITELLYDGGCEGINKVI